MKSAGTDLDRHQEQLLRYAFGVGVPLAVLTNGLDWWLYLPVVRGRTWEERRFARIDFRKQHATGAAADLDRFLNRDASVSGTAFDEADLEFQHQVRDRDVRALLPEAWGRVLHDPQVHDLLATEVEELSGHPPVRETVAEFLRGVRGGSSTETVPAPPPGIENHRGRPPAAWPEDDTEPATPASEPALSAETPGDSAPTSYQGTQVAAFWLDNARYEVTSWRRMLVRLSEQLVSEAGPVFAERVLPVRGRTRAYFSRQPTDLFEPLKIAGADLYVEGNFSANDCVRHARRVLIAVRGSDDGFDIELAE